MSLALNVLDDNRIIPKTATFLTTHRQASRRPPAISFTFNLPSRAGRPLTFCSSDGSNFVWPRKVVRRGFPGLQFEINHEMETNPLPSLNFGWRVEMKYTGERGHPT